MAVNRYCIQSERPRLSTGSSTPIAENTRRRSAISVGGAPRLASNSENRVSPRNAAPISADDQRLPKIAMVSGNMPDWPPSTSASERRRVAAAGTERSQLPLGPQSAPTSRGATTSPHERQPRTGAKSDPHTACRMTGSWRACSGTHCRSHSQIASRTGHSERDRAVGRYSARGGFGW